MQTLKKHQSSLEVELPIEYYVQTPASPPKEAILLLHGYGQGAEKFLNLFEPGFLEGSLLIAANGPFMVPEKRGDTYRMGHSWYFYDSASDEYIISMKPAVEMWTKIVHELSIQSMPKRIIGYSQGGYLASFVAKGLTHVSQVLGISSQFLDGELEFPLPFRMDAVHGDQDEICSYQKAKHSHEKLVKTGVIGEFVTITKGAHRMSVEALHEVKRLIKL